LLIIDVRDDLIDKDEALSLFMVLLNRFAEASAPDRFNKMIVFDEAHKYMDDSSLTDAITEAVREMRHKGVTLVISSQDPPSVPSVVVELSTVIVAHRMSAPTWLRALQRSSQAFTEVKPGDLAVLRNGQALLWSSGGSARYRTPQRIQIRPRLTEHGGHTVRVD
jgi:DNA helicase HerA-like ATPase